MILWVAAGLAFWADSKDPGQGMATLGLAIVGVIVVNGVFSFVQVYRAERALAALEKLLPHQVRVLRDGVFRADSRRRAGSRRRDRLEAGDLIPADCRLIEAFGVRVNNATVTGESVPKARDAHPAAAKRLPAQPNVCWRERRSSRALARLSSSPPACTPSSARSPT